MTDERLAKIRNMRTLCETEALELLEEVERLRVVEKAAQWFAGADVGDEIPDWVDEAMNPPFVLNADESALVRRILDPNDPIGKRRPLKTNPIASTTVVSDPGAPLTVTRVELTDEAKQKLDVTP